MAQIGIGTKKAASSAQLEIVALRKGVLLPRVELKEKSEFSPIEGERIESLLVYHIGNANLVSGFYYWKSNEWTPLVSGDTFIDRKNNTFTIEGNPTKNAEESLVITDTENHSVYLAVADIANNSTFVTNLVDNQEFTTKLGNKIEFINQITHNQEFIDNIVIQLKGKYGNVQYNAVTNEFFYYDEQGGEHEIDWAVLNTTNVSFTLVNDHLVVTDSENNTVSLAVAEIANNSTFITNLVDNQEFITKLGDNSEFQTIIKNNSVETVLTLTDGTINAENVKAGFNFNNGKNPTSQVFAETLTALEKGVDAAQKIEYTYIDETGAAAPVKITITQDVITDFEKIINDTTVNNLLKQFITTATGDVSVIRDTAGDVIIKTAEDAFNLSEEIRAQETNTQLTSSGGGIYVYKNEEAIKNNGAGITINVVSDVQNNFQEIIDHTSVQTILEEYLTNNISNVKVINKNGDTVFVVNEGGVETEVNISEIIRGESYVASLELQDETTNTDAVKAGFRFKDGKNPTSQVFAETLTALEKGVDAAQKIEYTYIDETGAAAPVKITITQDVITDFEKIINDTTVNNLLKQFITTATGDVSVIRDTAGDVIIKTAEDAFNLSEEIRAQETNTQLTSSGGGIYVYKNEEAIKNNGAGIAINVVSDVQNNFQEIIDNTSVKHILNEIISDRLDASVTYENDTLFVNYKDGRKEAIEIKDVIQSNGETLSTDGVIGVAVNGVVGNEVQKAVVKPFKLTLKEESVTTGHIKNETLLLEDFAKGVANTVLATDQTGTPYWMNTNDITKSIQVDNGLTTNGNKIQLGGTLTQPTAITVGDTNHLALKNVSSGTGTNADQIVVLNSEGVLKQVNAAMPRYFYMPATTIPSHDDLTGLALTGTIEVNLYEIYKNQYGFTDSATQVRSNPSSNLPVYTSNELDYFVTYYDNDVFTNVTLSSSGVLRYQVRSNSEITASTYMNIVFKVKE